MIKTSKFSSFLLATLVSLSLAETVNASTRKLTVVVDGLRHKNGQVCLRIYSSEKGFPMSDKSEVQSGCTKITGNSVTKQFYGLKPGNYAVAVLDDEHGDHKLHTNFLGIPEEGFGISNNPTVSVVTGAPKFKDASFSLKEDKTIRIVMKYSLD
jgi:uncharacterized protein (DUF2141 family)